MVIDDKVWSISLEYGSKPWDEPFEYDPQNRRSYSRHGMPVTLVAKPAAGSTRRGRRGLEGVRVLLESTLTTTRYHDDDGQRWRDPWQLGAIPRMVIEADDGALTEEQYVALGLRDLQLDVRRMLRQMAEADPHMFTSSTTALPSPGAAGHGDAHYAKWVRKYLNAVEAHGPDYMTALLAENPGSKKGTIYAWLDRAEQRGLLWREDFKPGPGRVRAARMTEKCERVLADSESKVVMP